MSRSTIRVEPTLLRRINERRLLEIIQANGPASRARLRALSGLTAPTVSKGIDALLAEGLVEEIEPTEPAVGRPGRLLRMAGGSAFVLGVLLDAGSCSIVVAGLDGRIDERRTRRFAPPKAYGPLLDAIATECRAAVAGLPVAPQAAAVVVNGLIKKTAERVICAANLPVLDGRTPSRDLAARLDMPMLLLKGTAVLCLGERIHGAVDDPDNFAVLDMTSGLGLAAISGGAAVVGHSGFAGEIGHVVVDPGGVACGCGHVGCLETVATDAALVRRLSARVGHPLDREAAAALLAGRPGEFTAEIDAVARGVALASAMVATMLNPATIVIHSEFFLEGEGRLEAVGGWLSRLGLQASVADCRLVASRSTREQAAVAGMIHEITRTRAPALR